MRTIKFRAWDKELNTFRPTSNTGNADCLWYDNPPDEMWNDTGIHWQQFTGLLDKNGKEIYEGDLLRAKQNAWGYVEHLLECKWDTVNTCFKFVVVDKNTDTMDKQSDGTPDIGSAYASSVVNNWAEIIGNIYENPDLPMSDEDNKEEL